VIAKTVSELPKDVECEHGAAVEARLVAEAQRFDPSVLATLARRVVALLNPDVCWPMTSNTTGAATRLCRGTGMGPVSYEPT